jgi:arylsulfatase A-like enzyme
MTSEPARLPRKPNLILFLPDQQRADTLACYGGVKVHAPNLSKLASESVIFERTYVTRTPPRDYKISR